MGGRDNGRKPLGRETVKGDNFANSLSSVGTVARMGKVGGAAREPMFLETISFQPAWKKKSFQYRICKGRTERTGKILGICTVGRNASGHKKRG